MKKYKFVAMMALLVSCLCLSACANGGKKASEDSKTSEAVSKETGKLKIVTTIFPVYDWVKELLGDRADQAEITLLLKDQADLHSYQPSAEDILKISDCDLFIHVGGESDKWVADTLKQGKNPDRKVINLLDQLGSSVKEEELVEGMEAEPEHEEGEKEEEGPEYDEHVWLSLKNAGILCGVVANTLKEIDPEYAEHYQKRADAYIGRLDKLDRRCQETADAAAQKTLVFGDRFPFRYLADDYGFTYYAAFAGCSAETEASFKTSAFLADKMDQLQLKCIFTIDKPDQKIAKAVIANTREKNQKILTLDSMQYGMSEKESQGHTYLSIMEQNLEVLKDALQ